MARSLPVVLRVLQTKHMSADERGGNVGLSLDDGKLLLSTTFADNFLSTPNGNSNIPNFTSAF